MIFRKFFYFFKNLKNGVQFFATYFVNLYSTIYRKWMGKEENKINQREKKVIIEQNGKSSSNINHNPNFWKDIKSFSAMVIAIWDNFPLPQFDEGFMQFFEFNEPKNCGKHTPSFYTVHDHIQSHKTVPLNPQSCGFVIFGTYLRTVHLRIMRLRRDAQNVMLRNLFH